MIGAIAPGSVRRGVPALLLAAALAFPPNPALAASASIARDAEVEALVQDYARPIFQAAGIRTGSIQILLIPDPSFNAFVADSSRMFINTGTIIDSETPNEVIGVLAHETAHLAHGDLAGLRQAIEDTKAAVLVGALVGIGAAIAGAVGNVDGLGSAGAGVIAGSMHVGQRNILAYQRTQEAAADRSPMDYLDATSQSPTGMVTTMRRLANDTLLSARGADPYIQSHPLPAERVSTLEALAAKSRFADRRDPPEVLERHELARAKLAAFTMTPQQLGRRYAAKDMSLPARYARAIVAYRFGGLGPAVKQIDALIKTQPDNPYFRELKGQALLEGGKPAESVAPLARAVELQPRSGLLRILYGQALVASGNKADLDEAIRNLTVGLQSDPDMPVGWRTLARAHALKNDIAMAELATAQGLFVDGNVREARIHAERAQVKLKEGTPAWLRADDIVSYKPPKRR